MTLTTQTRIGLTFGQMIALIGLFIAVGSTWMNMNIRMSNVELQVEQMKKQHYEDNQNVKELFQENKADHEKMSDKMDKIYSLIINK